MSRSRPTSSCPSTTCSPTRSRAARDRAGCSTRPRSPRGAGCPTRRHRSRPGSSRRRPTGRWSSSPAPGSGKTETMAARVVLAGRQPARRAGGGPRPHLHPQGGQRAQRAGPAAARRAGPAPRHRAGPAERLAVAQPTVATYHGYAAALVAEHGLRIGVEPGAGVLGPAMCWGQAATVVVGLDRRHERRPADAAHHVEDVLALAAELGEHDISPAALRDVDGAARGADRRLRRRRREEGAVRGGHRRCWPGSGPGGAAAAGRGVRGPQARGRRHRLRRPGGLRRADRGRAPPRSAGGSGRAGRSCCSTSTRTPASVSCACWRRCSARHRPPGAGRRRPAAVHLRLAGCLRRHDRALRPHLPGSAGPPAERLTLATSWRNDRAVLAVANAVSAMLPPPDQPLPDLAPAPTAGPGAVTVGPVRDRRRGDRGAGRPARRRAGDEDPAWRARTAAPDGRRPRPRAQAAARASPRRCASAACRSRSSGSVDCSRSRRSPTSSRR